MAKDYYKTLGIERDASKDEVKKAFRKLAQKYHPDKPEGDEVKFKEINEAYTILSDDKKRAQYDQFGEAFSGGGAHGGFDFSNFDFSQFQGANGQHVEFDIGDLFGNIFGGGAGRMRKGRDIQVDVTIDFRESVFGAKKKVSFQRKADGSLEDLDITIPQGIDDGEMLRVRSKGEPVEDGRPGDLYIRIHVTPHETLRKEGVHLVRELNIKLTEAILGSKREIDTLDGKVTLKIPKGISHGEILRIKGEGVPVAGRGSGDLLVRILVPTPQKLSRKAKQAIEELKGEGL